MAVSDDAFELPQPGFVSPLTVEADLIDHFVVGTQGDIAWRAAEAWLEDRLPAGSAKIRQAEVELSQGMGPAYGPVRMPFFEIRVVFCVSANGEGPA